MGRRGRTGRLPRWAKGAKIYDDIDGSEIYERASSTMSQRGLRMHRSNYDKLTDEEREASIEIGYGISPYGVSGYGDPS